MPRKKIGLALSGGGARGFSHIGVLRVLVENKIPIDMIAGTSAGSVVGGAFAAGMSVDEIAAMAANVGWFNLTRPSLSPLGVLSNAPMGRFLNRYFPVTKFDDLAIPFGAVVYDFEKGEELVLRDSGDLIFAIRASCAVPGVFAPLRGSNGGLLVDGGIVSPTPTNAVRQMGADIVIAVDLLSCGSTFRGRPKTAFGMVFQSALALIGAAAQNQRLSADVVIEPELAHLRPDEIKKHEEFITLGESATRSKIDEILAFIN